MERRNAWVVGLAMLVLAGLVGTAAFNAGVSHGLAIAAAAGDLPQRALPYFWYRPWGFGFFGPLWFLLFFFVFVRMLLWGRFGGRRFYGGPFRHEAEFEEWHRQAHEKMK